MNAASYNNVFTLKSRMMSEARAQIEELINLLHDDPNIDEAGWISGDDKAAFSLEYHKLGIALPIAAPMFQHARNEFHAMYAVFKSADDQISCGSVLQRDLHEISRVILLLSADFYTAWNLRRQLIIKGYLEKSKEISFCSLVLSLHPKSIDTWAYRRWLAKRIMKELDGSHIRDFLVSELRFCDKVAEQSARNYHVWSYRHMITLEVHAFRKINTAENWSSEIIKAEFAYMQSYCRMHLADSSAWNHRASLLSMLIELEQSDLSLRVSEYQYLMQIVAVHSVHETLWYYRRFLIQHLCFKDCFQEGYRSKPLESLLEMARNERLNCETKPVAVGVIQLGAKQYHEEDAFECQLFVCQEIEEARRYPSDLQGRIHPAWRYILWLLFYFFREVALDMETEASIKNLWNDACIRGSIYDAFTDTIIKRDRQARMD